MELDVDDNDVGVDDDVNGVDDDIGVHDAEEDGIDDGEKVCSIWLSSNAEYKMVHDMWRKSMAMFKAYTCTPVFAQLFFVDSFCRRRWLFTLVLIALDEANIT